MPNNYFEFKQFAIHQKGVAMKVGTDGVLLGAWANVSNAAHILDVGTGTGLLAIMLAQRNSKAVIDAIEIDEAASIQAQANVQSSPWANRIKILCVPFQKFATSCCQQYDLIISNPPYFNNSLKSLDEQRTTARHTDSLPYSELILGAKTLLKQSGCLSLILPAAEGELFIKQAEDSGLYCCQKLNVKPSANKAVKRVLLEFVKQASPVNEQTLCIENGERHNYTSEYKLLAKDFYLNF